MKDRRIVELEAEHEACIKERKEVKKEMRMARDEVGAPKDEAEEAKLELKKKNKEFEVKLAEVKERAWEKFKTSNNCDKIKSEYTSRAYLHTFKET